MTLPLSFYIVSGVLVGAVLAVVRFRTYWRRHGVSFAVVAGAGVTLAIAGLALFAVFALFDLDLERSQPLFWGWVVTAATLTGLGAALKSRRLPGLDLLLAVGLVYLASVLFALAAASKAGVAAPPLRALLVVPAALELFAYFGASLGYLLWGAGRFEPRVDYEGKIGRRFLLSKSSTVLSTVTAISVVGVTLGVWLVIISLGVLSGFEDDLQRKIIGANAHVVVHHRQSLPFALDGARLRQLADLPEVTAFAPTIDGEIALASQSNFTGGILYGMDPVRSPAVLTVLTQLATGSLEPLVAELRPQAPPAADDDDTGLAPPAPVPGLVIGREMASTLNVQVGDRVRIISPLLEVLTPVGPAPKSLDFRVAAIFNSQMYEFDARYAFATLPAARRFFELGADEVTGVQLAGADPERSDAIGAVALKTLDPEGSGMLEALDWKRRNQTLFAALKLERVVAFVVLAFIILVASFSIVNTLTMSVIEKRKEIAILKTTGATDVSVMKVFLVQGMLVGAFGTLIGAVAAVVTALLLKRFGFGIPGEVYYIDSLPVHVGAGDVMLVVFAAIVIVWDFAVFPALGGSRLAPVEGLRDG
ncbi:MAG: ABC transporter permease [Deltaproteobacteria bacterium]|nr:ABC transporter permease [Deltaproteobacteria bacterium]